MDSRCGLRLEGAWLVRIEGASTCGGRAYMHNRHGLRLEGAWLDRVGGASIGGGGAKMQSRRGLRLEGLVRWEGLPHVEAGL